MDRYGIRTHIAFLSVFSMLIVFPAASSAQSCAAPVTGDGVSITRDQYLENLREHFGFTEPAQLGGTVTMADRSDIATLNGLLITNWPSRYIGPLIFEKLAVLSPIDGTPVPQLADFWEISENGRTYTFHLSEQAKWHDGVDFTAEDVRFSYDMALLQLNQNPTLKASIASFEPVDDNTFVVKLKEPRVTFLWDGPAAISIVPAHIWKEIDPATWRGLAGSTGQPPTSEDQTQVIGTGPFKYLERVVGDHVTLIRNEDHYSTVPYIDRFVFQVVENSQLDEALIAGSVDMTEGISVNFIQEAYNSGLLEQRIFPTMRMQYLAFNTENPPLDDLMVRQALFVGLDRQSIISRINLGYGEVAQGMQSPMSFAYSPDTVTDSYDFDQNRARTLLENAGWSDTNGNGIVDKSGQDLSLNLVINSDAAGAIELVTEIENHWEEIGVKVNSSIDLDFNTLQAELDQNTLTFDVIIRFVRGQCHGSQRNLFHSPPIGGMNIMGWTNAEYDAIDDQQLREADPAIRRELLIQLSNLAWRELPIGVLRFFEVPFTWDASVHNVAPNDFAGPYWSAPFMWKEAAA